MRAADLSITERDFPFRVRADLQQAVEEVIESKAGVKLFCGVREPAFSPSGVELSALMVRSTRTSRPLSFLRNMRKSTSARNVRFDA